MTESYYKKASGVILVYDVTRKETLLNMIKWIRNLEKHGSHPNLVRYIVANKTDLA